MNDKRNLYGLLGICATLIVQAMAAAWWASNINSRVEKLEKDMMSVQVLDLPVRMARLEIQIAIIAGDTTQIKQLLEKQK